MQLFLFSNNIVTSDNLFEMKSPFFWSPVKITIVIAIFSVIVLGMIIFYIYVGAVEASWGTVKK